MGTTVRYNGVTLANVITREFSQQPKRDRSNTDQIAQRFLIRVEAIANVQALLQGLGVTNVLVAGSTAVDVVRAVRAALGEDRGEFQYEIDGHVLLYANPLLDLNNGPQVIANRITHVTSQTIRIEFAIEVWIVDQFAESGSVNSVLNNRWSSTDDIDEAFRTTRTWKGNLRIASSAVLNAHAFRFLCTPRLVSGWRRKKMHFTVAANGLELSYTIVDQQMLGEAPPFPAARWTFTHSEFMEGQANKNSATFRLRMEGTVRADKWLMMEWALRILYVKLALRPKTARLKSLTIVDYGGDSIHAIEVRGSVTRTVRADQDKTVGAASLVTIGRPISDFGLQNYNPNRPVQFGPYGTADAATLAGLFGCYLQTPTYDRHAIHQVDVPDPPPMEPIADDNSDVTANVAEEPNVDNDNISSPSESDEQQEAIYEHIRLESSIRLSSGVVALPRASATNSEDDDDESGSSTVTFVTLHRATAERTIKYEAERVSKWPTLWRPSKFTDTQGIEYRLKSWTPIFQARTQLADGQVLHSVDAEYTYLMSRPPLPGEPIATVALPWDKFTPNDNKYPSDSLIDPDDSEKGFV